MRKGSRKDFVKNKFLPPKNLEDVEDRFRFLEGVVETLVAKKHEKEKNEDVEELLKLKKRKNEIKEKREALDVKEKELDKSLETILYTSFKTLVLVGLTNPAYPPYIHYFFV